MFEHLPKLEKLLLFVLCVLSVYGIIFTVAMFRYRKMSTVRTYTKPTDISSVVGSRYEWPRVFTDPNFSYEAEYPDEGRRKFAAIADGLNGWANCYAGEKAPETFGDGMVKIDRLLGMALPEKLMEMSKEKEKGEK